MAEISLHDYLVQINNLLEENRLSETIAHCRHILRRFPWHVETYRLYGKALLEQQKYDDAVDIFRRVLSADPEDFVSHVGLAITHKEKNEVPEAIWHMERAFEVEPYNGTIQEELRGLYANRDGARPERIHLTRGALARLYFKGNLYQQAAAELRQVLSSNETRIDLQTLLAETLWRDDQRVDVVDVCLQILDKLPNCIKANAILAEVWLVSGRIAEAQEYLLRLRRLTQPELAHLEADSILARAFGTVNGSLEIPAQTFLEELDYFPTAHELGGDADWVKEFGVAPEGDQSATWLDGLSDGDGEIFTETAESEENLLDWLREVAEAEANAAVETAAGQIVLDEGQLPTVNDAEPAENLDWLSENEDVESEATLGDVPDWLSAVTASAEAEMWNTAIEADESLEADRDSDDQASRGEAPDWIQEVSRENEALENSLSFVDEDEGQSWIMDDEAPGLYAVEGEPPDWLQEDSDEDSYPNWLSEPDDLEDTGGEELPNWLTESEEDSESIDAFPELALDESVYKLTGEEIPEWLLGNAGETADQAESTAGSASDPDLEGAGEEESQESGLGGLPTWLIEAEEQSDEVAEADYEAMPEWLTAGDDSVDEMFSAAAEDEIEGFDETAKWLIEFDETEQTGEEPETRLDESPELILEHTDNDQEPLPDWLEEDEPEGMVREEMAMGNAEDLENNEPDIPEDLDDAMKWLEELAAEQGADLAELPSLQPEQPPVVAEAIDAEAIEADDVPDWLKADLSEGELSPDDDLPDWLKNESATIVDADWLNLSEEDDFSELEMTAIDSEEVDSELLAEPSGDIPDWLKAQMPEDLQAEPSSEPAEDADLGWLEQIAAGEGSALEELPTLSWDSEDNDAILDFDRGDLTWLDEMVEEEGLVEPEVIDLPDEEVETAEEIMAHVPDDPDEAMAWLENLAALQGAPLDELPTVIDQLPAISEDDAAEEEFTFEADPAAMTVLDLSEEAEAEFVAENEVPEDPDEAMAWLERLAEQQGAPIDELPTMIGTGITIDPEAVEAVDPFDHSMAAAFEAQTVIDRPEPDEVEIEADSSEFDIPDDPDEAMAWLEKLAAQQGAPLDELPTVDIISEMPTPVTGIGSIEVEPEMAVEMAADMEPAPDTDFDMALSGLDDVEMPEDDDEALAWLEALAGGGAGVLADDSGMAQVESSEAFVYQTVFEESPPFKEVDAFEASDEIPFQVEEIEETAVDEWEEIEEAVVDDSEEMEEVSLFDAIEDETDQFIDTEDSLAEIGPELEANDFAEALPEWLQFGSIGESSQADLDWLDSYDDTNSESWLASEEMVSTANFEIPKLAVVPEPVAFEEQPEPVQELEDSDKQEDGEISYPELAQIAPLDQSQLESARTALEIGDYGTALDNYKSLLDAEQNLPLLISELETESQKHSKIAGLHRMLGDAYMQNGQLQKAIDTYRQALDNI